MKTIRTKKRLMTMLTGAMAAACAAAAMIWLPGGTSSAPATASNDPLANMYRKPAPAFDLNLSQNIAGLRTATGEQLAAVGTLRAATGSQNLTLRWNSFGGSPDVIYDFASAPFSGTPEQAGRAFITQNAGLFGVSEANNVRLFSERQALGGSLMRFQQTFNGIPVINGGIGIVMNGQNQV